MKQLVHHLDTGQTELVEVPRPRPGPHEVLIRARCSVVSSGTERMLVSFGKASMLGKARQQPERVGQVVDKVLTDGLGATWRAVRARLERPLPLGYSMMGVVEEVGAQVRDLLPGDRVVSNGPHAELALVSRRLVARVPDGVAPEHAAFAVLAAVAMHGVREAEPQLGEVFAVVGLGVVGLLAVQLLAAHGCEVLGVDLDRSRLALARRLGAAHVALAGRDDLPERALELTGRRGLDGTLLCVDTDDPSALQDAVRMCRTRGRVVLVGQSPVNLSRDELYAREVALRVSRAYGPGRHDPRVLRDGLDYPLGYVRWTPERNFEAALTLMARGRLDVAPLITARMPFARAPRAYEALLARDHDAIATLFDYPKPEDDAHPALAEAATPWRITIGEPPSLRAMTRAVGKRLRHTPRVGVIGAGRYAEQVFIPAMLAAGVEPVMICAPSGTSASLVARRFHMADVTTRPEDVLDDDTLDALFLLTRHDSHARLAAEAIERGRHVYVEKPLATTREGLSRVQAALESYSQLARPVLMVGFNRRYAPHVLALTSRLERAAGTRQILITVNAGRLPEDHWLQDASQGGRLAGEVCHFLDLARALGGHPVTRAEIVGDMRRGVTITLELGEAAQATILYLVNGHASFPKERVEVFVEGQVFQIDNFRVAHVYGGAALEQSGLGIRQDKGHEGAVRAFMQAVARETPPPIPAEELLEIAALTLELDARVRS